MTDRRQFIGGLAAIAAGGPRLVAAEPFAAPFMWAALVHLGRNMWSDCPAGREKDNPATCFGHTRMDFDETLWREATERMAAGGVNTLVLDLGEGVVYPSHPELAVKGSWTPDKLKGEIARLSKAGIEVVPKLNFSTCHDTWLGEYSRMVSTRKYYRVCAEVIGDVFDIFGAPRLFHLGYDEETDAMQTNSLFSCVRRGELWWHDFLFFVKGVEKRGARAWIWSDYMWDHEDEFLKRMPKSVLQSNWYYGRRWEGEPPERPYEEKRLAAFEKLDKAGFDQVPTGTNWVPPYFPKGEKNDANFAGLVKHCRAHVSPERLKGFMNASWASALNAGTRARVFGAIDQIAAEAKKW